RRHQAHPHQRVDQQAVRVSGDARIPPGEPALVVVGSSGPEKRGRRRPRPPWRMANINHRKRAAHRRRVLAALPPILNDRAVMPNADCQDLIVSVSRVEFGRTVREIYIDLRGEWRQSRDQWAENPHDRYMREARARGEITYADLTDVFVFPTLAESL